MWPIKSYNSNRLWQSHNVRAPNAKQHAAEGTGLGLAIVREVAEAHGGDAVVEVPAGEGTTVCLRFPLHHMPAEVDRSLPPSNEPGYPDPTPGAPGVPA